jgi:hypothetical protein
MNPRVFPNASALLAYLTQAGAQGKYLYRGQTHRYPPYRLPGADGTPQDVEALYPNDLRFIRELDATAPDAPAKLTAARKAGRDRRDKFMLFLKKGVSEGRAELVWLKDILAAEKAAQIEYMQWLLPQPGAELLMDRSRTHLAPYKLRVEAHQEMWRRGLGIGSKQHTIAWSLAQHYELATALVDVTDDARVALWFATHQWDATRSPPAPGSEGVVYRFDREQLNAALEAQFLSMLAWALKEGLAPAPPLFVQEIADIPQGCALRPSRQRGFSIYGFDQMQLVQFIIARGICEIFTFVHGAVPALDPIDRDYLVPKEDPFDVVLAEWRQQA